MNASQSKWGLVPRTAGNAAGSSGKVINLKIRVDDEFHARWINTLQKLSTVYSGGGVAIAFHAISEILPKLEAEAAGLPDSSKVTQPTQAKKGGSK